MGMKNFILVFSTVAIAGCALGPMDPQTRVIKEKRIYQPVDSNGYDQKNKEIEITYEPSIDSAGLSVDIKNLTSKPMKIVWDETALLDPTGQSVRIFHNGVVIKDRSNPQPPSVILPNGHIADQLVPVSSPHFVVTDYTADWLYYPICGERELVSGKLDEKDCRDKTFGFFITYEIGGKKKIIQGKFKYISVDKSIAQAKN